MTGKCLWILVETWEGICEDVFDVNVLALKLDSGAKP